MQPRRPLDARDARDARYGQGRDATNGTSGGRRVRPLAPAQLQPTAQRPSSSARLRRGSSPPRTVLVGRLMRGAALLGVAALAALGVVQLTAGVERSDAFARALPVRTIAVHGVDGARADEVLAYADVAVGVPLFSVDVDAVAARVLEHPFIAQARVRRVTPDGIEITVTSRQARAVLSEGTGLYLVDGAGHVMKSARVGDGLDLPVITGIDAARIASGDAAAELVAAVSLVAAHEAAGSPGGPLGEVHAVSGAGFELVLAADEGHGARVRIGNGSAAADWHDKLARLSEVLRRLDQAGRKASYINIDDDRRPERAAVRLRTEAEMRPAGGMNIPRERG